VCKFEYDCLRKLREDVGTYFMQRCHTIREENVSFLTLIFKSFVKRDGKNFSPVLLIFSFFHRLMLIVVSLAPEEAEFIIKFHEYLLNFTKLAQNLRQIQISVDSRSKCRQTINIKPFCPCIMGG